VVRHFSMTTQTHLLANIYCTTFVVIIQVRIPIKLYSINIINLVKLCHMYFLVISMIYAYIVYSLRRAQLS
jgi:hypothetical protein